MSKILITESRLIGVVKKLVNQFIKEDEKEISFFNKDFGQLDAFWEISLQDINFIGMKDNGDNLFQSDILVEKLMVQHPQNPDYIIEAHPSHLDGGFTGAFQQIMNNYISGFIPNVYVKVNFISPDSIL